MQGKVSMVVPCYNKADFIGAMLDSVLAQEWDNIEVILVNDGSTDGTREIIAQYEPKLKARGFEAVIIDQENAGCCAAVYAGLLRMSGKYFCLVDCDDEIEPQYVSHMANWLDTHEDCDWAACSYRAVDIEAGAPKVHPMAEYAYRQDTCNLLEKNILRKTITTVWIYMTRVSYLKKCGLVENFCSQRRKTYEPLIMVPLAFGKGKLEFFNEPLYRYNQTALDLFRFKKFEDCIKYYEDYLYLYDWSIGKLNASSEEKRRLYTIARLAYYKELVAFIPRVPDGKEHELSVAQELSDTLDEVFEPAPRIEPAKIVKIGFQHLFAVLERNVLGEASAVPALVEVYPVPARIIAYGALGAAAAKRLPILNMGLWRPTELWDKNGDGVSIKKPDVSSLTAGDTVLVMPTSKAAREEIARELEGCPSRIININEIWNILQQSHFSALEKARLK